MVTAAFIGVIIVVIGLALRPMPYLSPVGGMSHVSATCESSVPREVSGMRWMVRDVGIFLYGCVFASKYIFFRRVACQPERLDAKRPLALSVPPLCLTAMKTLRSTR
jgi:hypothetical protein